MGEIPLKEMKALLDENDLDLSMRQLTTIPVHSLMKIPRATHLDFSNNAIVNIPQEFCSLRHITKLDLSWNRIVHLPSDFGELSNLVHLDLYKNEIEELPLSFGKLCALTWLDLKDNPLETELRNAAGDCLDEKGCKLAATRVVRLMKERATKLKNMAEQQRDVGNANRVNRINHSEQVMTKEKARKKKNKNKDAFNELKDFAFETKENELVSSTIEEDGSEIDREVKTSRKVKQKSASFLWRFFMVTLVFCILLTAFTVLLVMINCLRDSEQWFSSSKAFCKNVEDILETKRIPSGVVTNLKKAVHGILNDYNTLLMEIWLSMEEFGFVRYFEDLLGSLHEYVWPYSLLLRGYFTHLVETPIEKLYHKYGAGSVNYLVHAIWLNAKIVFLMLGDLIIMLADQVTRFTSTLVETWFLYGRWGDQVLNGIRAWWRAL